MQTANPLYEKGLQLIKEIVALQLQAVEANVTDSAALAEKRQAIESFSQNRRERLQAFAQQHQELKIFVSELKNLCHTTKLAVKGMLPNNQVVERAVKVAKTLDHYRDDAFITSLEDCQNVNELLQVLEKHLPASTASNALEYLHHLKSVLEYHYAESPHQFDPKLKKLLPSLQQDARESDDPELVERIMKDTQEAYKELIAPESKQSSSHKS